MTSINKLVYTNYKTKCFLCKFDLQEGDLIAITNNRLNLCLSCGIEKLNLRIKVLNDWIQEKEKMKKQISKYLNENLNVQNKYALKELENEK